MKFLYPSGGFVDDAFGILTTPGHKGIPIGIVNGMVWAADNQAFMVGFKPNVYLLWLEIMREYYLTCLFITCPDKVGNANQTLDLFDEWHESFAGWSLAFVAQDGQENLDFPPAELWDCLFIGGTTIWKMNDGAMDCIVRAQKLGKHIHIGRVNYMRRYLHFAQLEGSEDFTCDGTRNRFEGKDRTVKAWKKYMDSPKQYGLFVPNGNNGRQSDSN